VVPAVENALLCGHDLIFLGERGQAKTRMIRQLVSLLDEWMPIVAGSEIHDDPTAPSRRSRARSSRARRRDADRLGAPRRPLRREARDARRLDRDLIGDVDPIKVAQGRSLADEDTMHFGLVPRTHRGIFCINELPDLTRRCRSACST
jgi:magnesium chelatase subunit I